MAERRRFLEASIVAALITAGASIAVAFIQRADPSPQPTTTIAGAVTSPSDAAVTTTREASSSTSTAPPGTVPDTSSPSANGGLELVDVVSVGTDPAPEIEIKVRNTGPEVAFIKRVRFVVSEHVCFMTSGQVAASATYDVEFPGAADLATPFTVETAVSQSVDPSGATAVDAFRITLGVAEGCSIQLYEFAVELDYNESGLTRRSDVVTITANRSSPTALPDLPDVRPGFTIPPPDPALP